MNNKIKRTIIMISIAYVFMCITLLISTLVQYNGVYSWDELRNGLGDITVDMSNVTSDMYDLTEYIDIRRNRAVRSVDDMEASGLLPKKYANYMRDGINSNYFDAVCSMDYGEYISDVTQFIKMVNILIGMEDNYGNKHNTSCEDACSFMAYITENINNKGISFDIEGAHNKWHSVIESQINELELLEQDIEYYYELEICCDMRYISSIDVETKIILPKQITMGTFWMNLWHKNLFTRMFTEHNKLTESDTDALSYINLAYDAQLYDDKVADKAAYLLISMRDKIEDGTSNNGLSIVDITGIENENIADYVDSVRKKDNSVNDIMSTSKFLSLSISGYNRGEQLYLVYDVISCEHIDDIPSKQELCTTEWIYDIKYDIIENSLWSYLQNEAGKT